MAGAIYVAKKTAALVFAGKTVFIEEGSTMAREGHPILDAAGSMFEPVFVHFEVDGDTPPAPETPETVQPDPAAVAGATTPAAKDVRAWAAEQGIEVSPKGKLPDALNEQYAVAHPEA